MLSTTGKPRVQTIQEINYATAATPFGRVLLAANEVAVCAISVGDSDAELLADVQAEFPAARLVKSADVQLKRWLNETVAWVRDGIKPRIPLDLHGTDFQLRVWRALQTIPRGVTKSYSDIARQIGSPRAVRAVANACGSNRIALLVPCHRVVRRGGGLGGYRGGVEHKRAMLAAERRQV